MKQKRKHGKHFEVWLTNFGEIKGSKLRVNKKFIIRYHSMGCRMSVKLLFPIWTSSKKIFVTTAGSMVRDFTRIVRQ